MAAVDISFRIGGEAGQGVESSGEGYAQALTHAGFYIFARPNYHSRIRGGHNFFTIRASSEPVYAIKDTVEILMALNAETIERHHQAVVPKGAIIVDKGVDFDQALLQGRDVWLVRAPLMDIAREQGSAVMANTAILAVASALVDLDLEAMLAVINKNFRAKSAEIAERNEAVARAAYRWAQQSVGGSLPWALIKPDEAPQRVALTGNTAFAMGAIMAGCKFVAGYPMTPATSVLEYAAQHADEWGLVVKHAEDEIAAVNMCIGAAHAGVRAMAPTSGGGFDLMAEGLSLAGITETPLVIYLAQRPGPATGLATRTAQADLNLAIYSGHGEFPRAVLAPHTAEESFHCAARAFNIAEKYQCLVIVLADHHNATSLWSTPVEAFDIDSVEIDRGKLLGAEDLERMAGEYLRYKITDDGVSPRALPGSHPKAVYLATANEHREDGHITEDALISTAMVQKRTRKLRAIAQEMRPPQKYGPDEAERTFVCWGSTFGAVYEAMQHLNEQGKTANMVHFVDLWPFPQEGARRALAGAKRIIDVEGNATAQFAFLLHACGGIDVDEKVLKFDGREFTPGYILAALKE
ncbi:MAG: 2-oxoacid:acceptor oxidoreductase subunit alpha [Chloroflexi bacterium]|nr:2-oxoacid:acceptor oxidoreductase subunit alpha [Chloroflexota bacterium]